MAVDYDEISKRYDRHRHLDEPLAHSVLAAAVPREGSRLLELGCGTGGLTLHLEELHGGPVVGVDLSAGMLSVAAGKLGRTELVRSDALGLPFADGSFGLAAGVFFVHHIAPELHCDLAREIARVIEPGGAAAIVTTSHEQIRCHHLNRYFPSFGEIDCGRFPPIDDLRSALEAAGLVSAPAGLVPIATYVIDGTYLEKLRARHISTLEFLGDEEYRTGVRLFEERLRRGEIGGPYTHYGTLVLARRPARS